MTTHDVQAEAQWTPWTLLDGLGPLLRIGTGQTDDEVCDTLVHLAPEWVRIRASLLNALGPYPEARAAVAQNLLALEPSNDHRSAGHGPGLRSRSSSPRWAGRHHP